ncbi:MAG TPA: ATP-binding protein [Jiangellaceae bacterium]|nr:ATP-binding protein [Jiangellaceae bacterium]
MTQTPALPSDHVELRVPASGAYLAVLRTATAGLAARLNFTLDDIEDLRIAVDEACALLLPLAAPEARIECRFDLRPDQLQVAVSVPSVTTDPPARDTFAWTVLTALAGEVDATVSDGHVTLTLRKQREMSTG